MDILNVTDIFSTICNYLSFDNVLNIRILNIRIRSKIKINSLPVSLIEKVNIIINQAIILTNREQKEIIIYEPFNNNYCTFYIVNMISLIRVNQ